MQPSTRMSPAVVVALLAGSLRAVQANAPLLLTANGFPLEQLSLVIPAMGFLSLAISPFVVVVAGYSWGCGADVRGRWLPFAGLLFAAALVGFVLAYLVTIALVLLGPGGTVPALIGKFLADALFTLGLANVALAGLAGAAIGEFRTGKTRNSNTAVA